MFMRGSLARALRRRWRFPAYSPGRDRTGKFCLTADSSITSHDVAKRWGDVVIVVDSNATRDAARSEGGGGGPPDDLSRTVETAGAFAAGADSYRADLQRTLRRLRRARHDPATAGPRRRLLAKALALDDARMQQHLAPRARERPARNPVRRSSRSKGPTRRRRRVAQKRRKSEGRPLIRSIGKKVTELTGPGRSKTSHGWTRRRAKPGLLIPSMIRGENGTNGGLELGFEFNNIEADDTNFNVRARLTFFDVGRSGAEWRNDLTLGSTTLLATEYFRPLGNTKWFVAPSASYGRRKLDIFQNETRLAEYLQETTEGRIDFGYSFNREASERILDRALRLRVIGDRSFRLDGQVGPPPALVLRRTADSTRGFDVQSYGIITRQYGCVLRASASRSEGAASALRSPKRRFTTAGGGTTFDDTRPRFTVHARRAAPRRRLRAREFAREVPQGAVAPAQDFS